MCSISPQSGRRRSEGTIFSEDFELLRLSPDNNLQTEILQNVNTSGDQKAELKVNKDRRHKVYFHELKWIFQPGTIVFVKDTRRDLCGEVKQSYRTAIGYQVHFDRWVFKGDKFQLQEAVVHIPDFLDKKDVDCLDCYPLDDHPDPSIKERIVENSKKFRMMRYIWPTYQGAAWVEGKARYICGLVTALPTLLPDTQVTLPYNKMSDIDFLICDCLFSAIHKQISVTVLVTNVSSPGPILYPSLEIPPQFVDFIKSSAHEKHYNVLVEYYGPQEKVINSLKRRMINPGKFIDIHNLFRERGINHFKKTIIHTYEEARKTNSMVFFYNADALLQARDTLPYDMVSALEWFDGENAKFGGLSFFTVIQMQFIDARILPRMNMTFQVPKMSSNSVSTLTSSFV